MRGPSTAGSSPARWGGRAALATASAEAVFSKSPEEYAAYVRGENVRWGKIIHASGLAAK